MPGVRVKMAALVKYAVSTAGVTPSLLKRNGRLRGSRRTLPERRPRRPE
jgi:hypothetical protein